MHLEEIVLDGFKSYAKRVVIQQFDRQFNAVTGLNGTGKSNILDSICFVLGIKALNTLRAKSLHELVYKQGQAGVQKATVSLKFRLSNEDLSKIPLKPYISNQSDYVTITRQYQVGGKDTYFINGKHQSAEQVQKLCQGCNLNVNNPHFLIMQGQVTKVMNSKPKDFVSIIGESAGINSWEASRQNAEKQLLAKTAKEEMINMMLREDIEPQLRTLEMQKTQYHQHKRNERELESLQQISVAKKYVVYKRDMEDLSTQKLNFQSNLDKLTEQIKELERDLGIKKAQQVDLEKQIDKAQLENREKSVSALSGHHTQLQVALANSKNSLKEELENLKTLQSELEELDSKIITKKMEASTAQLTETTDKIEYVKDRLTDVQNELNSKDSRTKTLQRLKQQLNELETQQVQLESRSKQNTQNFEQLQQDIGQLEQEMSSSALRNTSVDQEVQGRESRIQALRTELAGQGMDENSFGNAQSEKSQGEKTLRQQNQELDRISQNLFQLSFQYQDPYPNFDRSKVYGISAKLFSVQQQEHLLALEIIAGGKLYNVVTESVKEAKALLQGGQLKRRYTFIPLDKISTFVLSPQKRRLIEDVSRQMGLNAAPAIDLVRADSKFGPAMQYMFGDAIVCQDSEIAKKIAYHPQIRCRCVTLEGDDFNPSGTLTGGSRNKQAQLLSQVKGITDKENQINELQQRLVYIGQKIHVYQQYSQEIAVLEHQVSLMREKQGAYSVEELQKQMVEKQKRKAELEDSQGSVVKSQEEGRKNAEELVQRINNFDQNKGQISNLLKKDQQTFQKELKNLQTQSQQLQIEVNQLQAQLEINSTSLEGKQKEIASQQQLVDEKGQKIKVESAKFEALEKKLNEAKNKQEQEDSTYDQQKQFLKKLKKEIEGCEANLLSAQMMLKKKQSEFQGVDSQIRALQTGQQDIIKANDWIPKEQTQFGLQGGKYDFDRYPNLEETLKDLEDQVRSCHFNQDVDGLYEKQVKAVNDLQEKREIVQKDKVEITESIAIIEDAKKFHFKEAYQQVNSDFGEIFSQLLPGCKASLVPVVPDKEELGLLPSVQFNQLTKSLVELSGGQRSLLALAFILSMLKTNPAPIYILDEVDAALDLSHTQNIGLMIQTQFPKSQFLIVSLKEQLFSNANVIFKTQFLEGVSSVIRKQNKKSKAIQENGNNDF